MDPAWGFLFTMFWLLLMLLLGPASHSLKVVQLNDVLNYTYKPQLFNGNWITDDGFLYPNKSSLLFFNMKTKKSNVVLANTTIDGGHKFVSFSSDRLYALFSGNIKRIYRHSFLAQYKIFNVETGKIFNLDNSSFLQLVEWRPGGHNLVFIKKNNLFYVHNDFQLTECLVSDGVPGVVFNGVADWVYEEEVLYDTKALWFSADGSIMAYAKFNDSPVHEMNYMYYGQPGSNDSQYPQVQSMRYPKAGTRNPMVELNVLTFERFLTFQVLPEHFTFEGAKEAILSNVVWTPNNDLSVTWTNREQNHANTFRCKLMISDSKALCELIFDFREENGWLDLTPPVFSRTDKSFLQIVPLLQEDLRYYPQLVLHTSADEWTALSHGKTSVTDIIGWDHVKQVVFYTAVRASHSTESHVYMVQLATKTSICLSCRLRHPCSYASAQFSTEFTYFTLICKGRGVPFVHVYYTYVEKTVPPILIWEKNEHLKNLVGDVELPYTEDVDVPLGDGFTALARVYRSAHMNLSETSKYPLVLDVYGGPGSNKISDAFSIGWLSYLASNRNIVVVNIDARGSAFRSVEQEFAVYRNLGRYEIADQIKVIKFLLQKFPWIDRTRVGVWGWSYGGFATAMIMSSDYENVFKCGISVAPVTSFLYYDSIYTERYMGLPSAEDNQAGYNWTDVTRKVKNFSNKTYFLIHGTADDNVHYQQSMMLSAALEQEDIFFYQQSYPDQNHNLGRYIHHVYHSMNHFWTECFQLEATPQSEGHVST